MAQLSPIQRNCRCFSLAQGALFFACAHTRYSQLGQHLHIHEYNSTQAFMSMTGCTMQLECLGEENILTITLMGSAMCLFGQQINQSMDCGYCLL